MYMSCLTTTMVLVSIFFDVAFKQIGLGKVLCERGKKIGSLQSVYCLSTCSDDE